MATIEFVNSPEKNNFLINNANYGSLLVHHLNYENDLTIQIDILNKPSEILEKIGLCTVRSGKKSA